MLNSEDNIESPYEGIITDIELHLRSPEFAWNMALSALEKKSDLEHGLNHLADLIAFDPGKGEWLGLLDRYIEYLGEKFESTLAGDPPYYANEALRAYYWKKIGRLADAVNLLFSVTHAKPDSQYFQNWLLDWLEENAAIESLSDRRLAWSVYSTVLKGGRLGNYSSLTVREVGYLSRWSELAIRFEKRFNIEQPEWTMMRLGLLRRAGELTKAEELARTALKKHPSWELQIGLGLILKEKNDVPHAEKAFLDALALKPADVSPLLENADMHLNNNNFESALSSYETVLKTEPRHNWAFPSSIFCRWKLESKSEFLNQFIDLAKSGNPRAQLLYAAEFGDLDEPLDATAKIIRQLRSKIELDPSSDIGVEVQLMLSCPESPSNFVALRLDMESLQRDIKFNVDILNIPDPDPRKPLGEIKYCLWKYDGNKASPALSPPSAAVQSIIAELALDRTMPSLGKWGAASRIAKELGISKVQDLLAVMVHPPSIPKGFTALSWLPRVHLACAQVVAQLDEGWDFSTRKEALLSILLGPSDWTTTAAISALTQLALREPAYSWRIADAFQKLSNNRPSFGDCCWEQHLYRSWLRLPHLFEDEKQELRIKLDEIEQKATKV